MYNHGKFHLYSICGCQVIKFEMFSWRWSIHEMGHFWGFLGPNSPKYGQILPKFLPEVVLNDINTGLQDSLKNQHFYINFEYPKFGGFVQL